LTKYDANEIYLQSSDAALTYGGLANYNIWTGTNSFNYNLPTSTLTATEDNQFVTRGFTNSRYGQLASGNTWTNTNSFNTYLPTSTLSPTASNQFVTKAFTDASYAQLGGNNTWTNTNSFNTYLPTSTLSPTASNQFVTKAFTDASYGQLGGNNTWTNTNLFTGNLQLDTTNGLKTANNLISSQNLSKTAINTTSSYISIGSITIAPLFKQQITFSTAISVARYGPPQSVSLTINSTETLTSILCDIYKNNSFYTSVNVSTNNTLPITKTYTCTRALNEDFTYEQYFTNVTLSFIPTELESTSSTYSFRFRLTYSSNNPPATTFTGYYFNTNVSSTSSIGSGSVTFNSPSGSGYSAANLFQSFNNTTKNPTPGFLCLDNLLGNIIRVLDYTAANYDSGWFAVSSNSTYNITHNLGWTFPNPPRIRLFYSDFSNPVLGTNPIYELSVNSMSGIYNDSSNYQYGINHIRHISSNQLRISTCVRGVYYSEGGEDVGAETSGYYRIIMYR
jgi:hypothetical protein